MTYNFHSCCKHMHLSFKSLCNKEHKELWLPRVILPKALVLQDECYGKNYSSFLDFTRNYERTSGIFVPCLSWAIRKKQSSDLPIAVIRLNNGLWNKKLSSLQDLICVPIKSALVANIFLLSSDKLTPPIVATSLMSSSSLKHNQQNIL